MTRMVNQVLKVLNRMVKVSVLQVMTRMIVLQVMTRMVNQLEIVSRMVKIRLLYKS